MFPHFTTKGDIIYYLISKACGRISGLPLDGENVSCIPTNRVLVKEPGCEMIPTSIHVFFLLVQYGP